MEWRGNNEDWKKEQNEGKGSRRGEEEGKEKEKQSQFDSIIF